MSDILSLQTKGKPSEKILSLTQTPVFGREGVWEGLIGAMAGGAGYKTGAGQRNWNIRTTTMTATEKSCALETRDRPESFEESLCSP
jgi:hypothetical protein